MALDGILPFALAPLVAWGVRQYLLGRDAFTKLKKATLGVAFVAFVVTEAGRSFYRPYIYAHEIDDWVIADTIGNSFGTVTVIFAILTLSGRGTARDWWLVAMAVGGLAGYELLNLVTTHPFDMNDLLATLVFGALSALLYGGALARYGARPLQS